MNGYQSNNEQYGIEPDDIHRYNVRVTFLEYSRELAILDCWLFKPEMDQNEVTTLIEGSGYSKYDPNYSDLVTEAKQCFTLGEVGEFLKWIYSSTKLDVIGVHVRAASLEGTPEKWEPYSAENESRQNSINIYDFSELDGYSLPFKVSGKYI